MLLKANASSRKLGDGGGRMSESFFVNIAFGLERPRVHGASSLSSPFNDRVTIGFRTERGPAGVNSAKVTTDSSARLYLFNPLVQALTADILSDPIIYGGLIFCFGVACSVVRWQLLQFVL